MCIRDSTLRVHKLNLQTPVIGVTGILHLKAHRKVQFDERVEPAVVQYLSLIHISEPTRLDVI
eukprot:1061952-Prorocentrum_lima.AAC.1